MGRRKTLAVAFAFLLFLGPERLSFAQEWVALGLWYVDHERPYPGSVSQNEHDLFEQIGATELIGFGEGNDSSEDDYIAYCSNLQPPGIRRVTVLGDTSLPDFDYNFWHVLSPRADRYPAQGWIDSVNSFIAAVLNRYGGASGFGNWGVAHEVYDQSHWSGLGYICTRIGQEDPNHPSLITGNISAYSNPGAFADAVADLDIFEHFCYVLAHDTPYRGTGFQAAIDELLDGYEQCRNLFFPNRSTVWHAIIQACEWLRYNQPYRRLPRPAEIRLQAYLALSRGAKGIKVFTYHSNAGGRYLYHGLVIYGRPRQPRRFTHPDGTDYYPFDVVAALYAELWDLREWINALRCVDAFNSENLRGYSRGVRAEELGSIQFGVFDHPTSDYDYFLVVNRVCSRDDVGNEADPQVIDICTDRTGGNGYLIEDLRTGEVFASVDGCFRGISIPAGSGRLFELRPMFQEDEVWSGVVNISGAVTVPSGRTLTIASGTVVRFSADAGLIVQGALDAQGNSSDPIVFTSAADNPSPGDWDYIKFDQPSGSSALKFCTIEYADIGLWLYGTSSVTVEDNTIRNCAQYGGYFLYSSNPTLKRNRFENNGSYGIFLYNSRPKLLDNNISSGNYEGLMCFNDSDPVVGESRFENNAYAGIYCSSSSDPILHYKPSVWPAHNWIVANANYGVYASSGCWPRLGWGENYYPGYNHFQQSLSTYAVYNANTSTLKAIYNEWIPYPPHVHNVTYEPAWNEPSYDLAEAKTPSEPERVNDKATQLLAHGETKAALDSFNAVVQRWPDDPATRYALAHIAFCYEAMGDTAGYLQYLEDVLSTYRGRLVYSYALEQSIPRLENTDPRRALSRCNELVDLTDDQEVREAIRLVRAFIKRYQLKDEQGAVEDFSSFLEDYPSDPLSPIARAELSFCSARALPKRAEPPPDQASQTTGQQQLAGNFPNPFNPSTTILFHVPSPGSVVLLQVYDVRGDLVRTLYRGFVESGTHRVLWDGCDRLGRPVPGGVYVWRLSVNGRWVAAGKMTLVK